MKKDTLEITFIKNGKPLIEVKNGYSFTVKTSDDFEIELFVFKEDNKSWNVTEKISTSNVSRCSTRTSAINLAASNIGSRNYNDYIKAVERSLAYKENLLKENK